MSGEIVNCTRRDAVRIENQNNVGEPLAITLPTEMLFSADWALRDLLMNNDAEIRIFRCDDEFGLMRWRAQYGGISGWSLTPWGALQKLGTKLMQGNTR